MGGPFYMPSGYRNPYGQSIADLMIHQGNIAAQQAGQSGAIWGGALHELGNIVAGAIQQHQARKDAQQRDALVDQAMAGWDWENPQHSIAMLNRAVGPDKTKDIVQGMTAARSQYEKMQKGETPTFDEFAKQITTLDTLEKARPGYIQQNYDTIRQHLEPVVSAHVPGYQFSPQFDPNVVSDVHTFAQQFAKPKSAEAPHTKDVPQADGSVKTYQYENGGWIEAPGLPAGAPKPEKEKVLSLDQQLAEAFASGDQTKINNILAMKAREAAATRKPEQAPEAEDFSGDVRTTQKGNKFIDLSAYTGKARDSARRWASQNGVRALSKEDAQALQDLTNARTDLQAAYDAVKQYFPSNVGGAWLNKGLAAAQVGESGSAMKAYHDTVADFAVRVARASSGGTGLRFSRDLLDKVIKSVPNPTSDTAKTAEDKMKRLETYLGNVESSTFGGTQSGPADKQSFFKEHGI